MWQKDILRADAILVMPRTCWRIGDEPFLLLHCQHGTGYWRSWNCCDRRTHFVVIWKHFVSFCLWAPGYRLTLWCVLGLLVGGEIQVPQLQLQLPQLQFTTLHGCSLCLAVYMTGTESAVGVQGRQAVGLSVAVYNHIEKTWCCSTHGTPATLLHCLASRSHLGWPGLYVLNLL